jgi:hypothetical protein
MCCCNSTCNCGGTCQNCQATSTDNIKYTGPDQPCTGIKFNDNLTLILQKLEALVCDLQTTVVMLQQTTTTTTTTIVSTTTTTTTIELTTTTTTTIP